MAGTRTMGSIKPYLKKEGNLWIFRYGFERIEDSDMFMYVEHRFVKQPSEMRMRALMDAYNKESLSTPIDIDKVIETIKKGG